MVLEAASGCGRFGVTAVIPRWQWRDEGLRSSVEARAAAVIRRGAGEDAVVELTWTVMDEVCVSVAGLG